MTICGRITSTIGANRPSYNNSYNDSQHPTNLITSHDRQHAARWDGRSKRITNEGKQERGGLETQMHLKSLVPFFFFFFFFSPTNYNYS